MRRGFTAGSAEQMRSSRLNNANASVPVRLRNSRVPAKGASLDALCRPFGARLHKGKATGGLRPRLWPAAPSGLRRRRSDGGAGKRGQAPALRFGASPRFRSRLRRRSRGPVLNDVHRRGTPHYAELLRLIVVVLVVVLVLGCFLHSAFDIQHSTLSCRRSPRCAVRAVRDEGPSYYAPNF